MNPDLALVIALLAATIFMFATNRPRMDAVALIMMTVLPLTGVISVPEALAGFSDPNIILIAALFVIGEGLVRTGVAQRMGDILVNRTGRNEARLVFLLMLMVAGIGSFMSSTGVVAIFIPIVLRIARNANIDPSRLMMPLSFAALISGMLTLVATAPNLVVHGELVRAGYDGFGFFAFTPFGIPILILAIGYMLFARRWLGLRERVRSDAPLPPRLSQWIDDYGLRGREHRLQVTAVSPLHGKRLDELELRARDGINIIGVERRGRLSTTMIRPRASTLIEAGDVLFLDVGDPHRNIVELQKRLGLKRLPIGGDYFTDRAQEIGMAELLVPATSQLIGKTVVEAQFRTRNDLAVIGIKRGQRALDGPITSEALRLGDTLLVVGPWRAIRRTQGDYRDLVALSLPAEFEDVVPAPKRAPFAIGVLALVVVMMATGVVPNVQAALIGGLLLGLFGCVNMASAYRSIHWQTLILIVGMLPFSIALQHTGGVGLASGFVLDVLGDFSPRIVLGAVFLITVLLGMFISNTATAVLMAPIALSIASDAGLSPYPFAMTVALAASTAFMTPVSSPVNTLVVVPGNYRFGDFLRVGIPFSVLTMICSVIMVPLLLPF